MMFKTVYNFLQFELTGIRCLILTSLMGLTSACGLNLQYGKRQTGSTFKLFKSSSLFSCAADCVSYRICKSFNFHATRSTCHLNGFDDLQNVEVFKSEADFIYSSISSWNKTTLGPCQDNTCAYRQRCILQRDGAIQCAEELSNIAENKRAYASSTWAPGVRADAAVDGKATFDWGSGSCFAVVQGDMSPWWLVDLVDIYIVVEVHVTSRGDCCPERLHDFALETLEADPRHNQDVGPQLCYMYSDAVTEFGKTVVLQCLSPVSGRYLRLSGKKPKSKLDHLQFCEVKVFGYKILYWIISSLLSADIHDTIREGLKRCLSPEVQGPTKGRDLLTDPMANMSVK